DRRSLFSFVIIRQLLISTLFTYTTLLRSIQVEEPSLEETVQILHGLNDRYEAHHRVTITDEAIRAAAELSNRYITDRFLPDKAIDLIDESGSKVRLRSYTIPPNLKE